MRRIIEPPSVATPLTNIKPVEINIKPSGKLGSMSFPDRVVIGNRKELEKMAIADKKMKQTVNANIDLFEPVYTQPKRFAFDKKRIAICIVEALIGFGITWFGVINAGSYFVNATRFGGSLFEWMYVNQFGTLFEIWGLIIIYDAIKRTGKV